jgi:hypothetical protein
MTFPVLGRCGDWILPGATKWRVVCKIVLISRTIYTLWEACAMKRVNLESTEVKDK